MDRSEVLAQIRACQRCPLAGFRKRAVPGRGETPASVLFVGEAPGKTENLRGKAFIGRAGKILDQGIEIAADLAGLVAPPSYYIANMVCCRPCDSKAGPNREPTPEEVWACRENLEAIVRLVSAEEVVFLGKVAERNLKRRFPTATPLRHPAYLARRGGAKSAEFRGFCRDLSVVFGRVKPIQWIAPRRHSRREP